MKYDQSAQTNFFKRHGIQEYGYMITHVQSGDIELVWSVDDVDKEMYYISPLVLRQDIELAFIKEQS